MIFLDPSTHEQAFGWPLRNVLTYLSTQHQLSKIRVIAFRDSENATGSSRVVTLSRKTVAELEGSARPGVVGWEKNDKGKLGPRLADLAPLMDPTMSVLYLVL